MTDKKYELLSREVLYQGYFRVDRFELRHELFAGGRSPSFTREVFERNAKVASVLLFDPQQDKVVLIEQFRAGIMAAHDYPWITEIVAGLIDGGETPEQTARREAME